MRDASDFLERYKDVSNFPVYGFNHYQYVYINDAYSGEIEFDPRLVRILNIDIEIDPSGGFPDDLIQVAERRVTAVTIRAGGRVHVLGCEDYTAKSSEVTYYRCRNEDELLRRFIEIWVDIDPDVVTGWNVEMFDIPYMVNRIRRQLGEDEPKKLSPWGVLEEREIEYNGKAQQAYSPMGLAILDYQHLYKKFAPSKQESYSLNNISHVVLKEKKLDYTEYESLHRLYYENYELFIDYNIRDTWLVEKLEQKLGYIQMVLAMAYDAKVNYVDTLTTVRPWDVIAHNHLMKKKIVVPQFKSYDGIISFVGGYVKEPQVGRHRWVVSFDLNSLYPHLIMQYNIGVESKRHKMPDRRDIAEIMSGSYDAVKEYLVENDLTITANYVTYDRSVQSFFAELMETMYNDRVRYRNLAKECKKKLKDLTDPDEIERVTFELSRYHNQQLAKKIQLNSAYGAMGNRWFRWFDLDNAEAITLSGRLSIRWVERDVNAFLNKAFGTTDEDYVIAIDTDSIYVRVERAVEMRFGKNAGRSKEVVDFVDELCENVIQPVIDRSFRKLAAYANTRQQKMLMKRETIADFGLWTAKKRYALHALDVEGDRFTEPEVKVTGLEVVRSSTPTVVREALKESIRLVLVGEEPDVWSFAREFREKFYALPFEQVAKSTSVSDLDKYSDKTTVFKQGAPQGPKSALLYNDLLKRMGLEKEYPLINEGDKVKIAYLKKPNPLRADAVAAPSMLPRALGLDEYIDKPRQFDTTYAVPFQKILDAVGWRIEKTASLEDLFGD